MEEKQELLPTSDSTFFSVKEADVTFTFHRNSDGKVTRFTLREGGDHPAERVRATPWTDQELSVYAGTYYSPELDTRYTIVVDNGKLVAKHNRLAPVSLTPPRAAAPFDGDKWYMHTVTFEKGADGTAQTLVGMAGRTRIRFEREK